MNLDRHVAELRQQLASAAASGGDAARELAEQLSVSLDAATRLVLLEALSEAAGEITREIAPGSVEVRLRGRDPEFAISLPPQPAFIDHGTEGDGDAEADAESASTESTVTRDARADSDAAVGTTSTAEDASTSRTTLRLPDQLKARVEKAAAKEGLSLNTWLVRAIADSLEPRSRRTVIRETRSSNSFTGWAR